MLCKYDYAVINHFSFIFIRFYRFLVFLLLVFCNICCLFRNLAYVVTWCGCRFPFGNSHFLGGFHYIFSSKCLFSPIQGIPSFILQNSSNHRNFQFFHITLSCCTKISPDHVTVTSHSKWRLTVNFLKNSHFFSEYSTFTYPFALLLCLYCVLCFSEQYIFTSVTKF